MASARPAATSAASKAAALGTSIRPRSPEAPRIEELRVENYRALRSITLKQITPLTALIGPNGSGKSTVFDVFAFLSECFTEGLRSAWERRGRFRELRTRGSSGPIVISFRYREPKWNAIRHTFEIDEEVRGPVVRRERLEWSRRQRGRPFPFIDFQNGAGFAVAGEEPGETGERVEEKLARADLLAVSTLGQFEKHPRVRALRDFITGWHLSYLSADDQRGQPEAGPQEHLSRTGDNLANVIQFLEEQHPHELDEIFRRLTRRIPRLERVVPKAMEDGRLLLQFKDRPFAQPIQARYASDGTLKMLSYLVLLFDPDPVPLLGIEEPENFLHPSLLFELAEECQSAVAHTQVLVTTHSPQFIDALKPKQVRILQRNADGFTHAKWFIRQVRLL